MPDYLSMENPYSNVRPRTRKEELLIEQLEQYNLKAHTFNESKKNERVITGPLKRYCGLCEAPLKSIKPKTLDIPLIPIDLPELIEIVKIQLSEP